MGAPKDQVSDGEQGQGVRNFNKRFWAVQGRAFIGPTRSFAQLNTQTPRTGVNLTLNSNQVLHPYIQSATRRVLRKSLPPSHFASHACMFYTSSPDSTCASSYELSSNHLIHPWQFTGRDRGNPVRRWRIGINDNAAMNLESNDADMIQLLDRIALQDAAALKTLYDLCSSKLFGLAVRVVSNREWAEDVLQESFLSIWRSAGDYRASLSPPMAWMGLIVRSRGLDFLRRRASQRTHLTQEIDEVMADTLALDAPTPMDTAQASEQAWALHQCLVKLENRQREVVSLAYVRDLSHSELALQLKLPLGTVKTWIRRGLEQLRVCMARFA